MSGSRAVCRGGCLAGLLVAQGCVGTATLAVGPTLDTLGSPGVEGQLRIGFGAASSSSGVAVPLTARLGSGGMTPAQIPYVLIGLDLPVLIYLHEHDPVGLRVGAGYTGRKIINGPMLHAPSLFLGTSGRLWGEVQRGSSHGFGGGSVLHLGGELRFDYLFGGGFDRAVFSLPLTVAYSGWLF